MSTGHEPVAAKHRQHAPSFTLSEHRGIRVRQVGRDNLSGVTHNPITLLFYTRWNWRTRAWGVSRLISRSPMLPRSGPRTAHLFVCLHAHLCAHFFQRVLTHFRSHLSAACRDAWVTLTSDASIQGLHIDATHSVNNNHHMAFEFSRAGSWRALPRGLGARKLSAWSPFPCQRTPVPPWLSSGPWRARSGCATTRAKHCST